MAQIWSRLISYAIAIGIGFAIGQWTFISDPGGNYLHAAPSDDERGSSKWEACQGNLLGSKD